MRNANDMGYECLLLTDCCGATDPKNHDAAISMIQKQGGVFGAVTTSDKFINSLSKIFLQQQGEEEEEGNNNKKRPRDVQE